VKTPRLERTLAVFSHFDGCQRLRGDDEGDIRIVIVKEGWFWVIPFRGDRTSVGVVLEPGSIEGATRDLDETLSRLMANCPPMASIMPIVRAFLATLLDARTFLSRFERVICLSMFFVV